MLSSLVRKKEGKVATLGWWGDTCRVENWADLGSDRFSVIQEAGQLRVGSPSSLRTEHSFACLSAKVNVTISMDPGHLPKASANRRLPRPHTRFSCFTLEHIQSQLSIFPLCLPIIAFPQS